MSRVTYEEKVPGDSRDADWFTGYLDDLSTATADIGRSNVAEEGIRRPVLGTPNPATIPFDRVANENADLVSDQAWGPLPAPLATQWTGTLTVKPGSMLRIRGAWDQPSTVGNPGADAGDLVELRIGGTKDAVAWVDHFSEVWYQPFNLVSSGLTTFATYFNDTGADVVFTMLELQAQVTTAAASQVRIGDLSLQAALFRNLDM